MAARSKSLGLAAGFIGAGVLNLLSLAGLADSIVEWRCFLQLDSLVAVYQAFKAYLFGLLPFHVPEPLRDYAIVTASFSVMLGFYGYLTEKKSVPAILAETEGLETAVFAVVLYVVPWVVLLWFVLRHVLWELNANRIEAWVKDDPEATSALKDQRARETRKARVLWGTVVGYPIACLALLFVFSDFAYTLFETSEIAGVSFRQECAATGEIIRIPTN